MKITYDWLKEFVDISLRPKELAEKLTMAGLEVTSLEKFGKDFVFEIEITSNRPDWLSVVGIAREVAAITNSKLKNQNAKLQFKIKKSKEGKNLLKIEIQGKKDCPLYTARVIRNVKVAPSPDWLTKRIKAVGLRPVNNIVDITNYVLYVTGQPLHAFDLDKLQGNKIIVRRANKGEEIVTIDAISRKLNPEILVIADKEKAKAIAGIMGGKDSEVVASTQNILLESAYFSPFVTRKSSRILALSSDSSYRFERSVDITKVVESSNLATAFILDIAGGEASKIYESGQASFTRNAVSLNLSSVDKFLGSYVAPSGIKSILRSLGFEIIISHKDTLKVKAPAFRQDIKCEADLMEEICRIYGYDKIPLTQAAIKPQDINEDEMLFLREKIREILAGSGFNEVINYSLVSLDSLKKSGFNSEDDIAKLENPLSIEQEVLRPNLLSGLLGNLSKNLELGNRNCLFFEVGDCFKKEGEIKYLGLAVNQGGFIGLKGIVELILEKLFVKGYLFEAGQLPFSGSAEAARLFVHNKEAGFIFKVSGEITSRYKIDSSDVFIAQLDLDCLKTFHKIDRKYKAIPRYPSLLCDLSLVMNEDISYQRLLEEIKSCNIEYLEAVKFKDVYCSESLGAGKKSITVSLEFRSVNRTLKDEEANSCIEAILARLKEGLGVNMR